MICMILKYWNNEIKIENQCKEYKEVIRNNTNDTTIQKPQNYIYENEIME